VIIDTREQLPYVFPNDHVKRMTLKTGDYSLAIDDRPRDFDVLASVVAVERKSMEDYWGCLARSRKRFERELERLKAIEWPLVIIECSTRQMMAGADYGEVPPSVATGSMCSWMQQYGVPFLLAGDRECGRFWTLRWLDMAYKKVKARERGK